MFRGALALAVPAVVVFGFVAKRDVRAPQQLVIGLQAPLRLVTRERHGTHLRAENVVRHDVETAAIETEVAGLPGQRVERRVSRLVVLLEAPPLRPQRQIAYRRKRAAHMSQPRVDAGAGGPLAQGAGDVPLRQVQASQHSRVHGGGDQLVVLARPRPGNAPGELAAHRQRRAQVELQVVKVVVGIEVDATALHDRGIADRQWVVPSEGADAVAEERSGIAKVGLEGIARPLDAGGQFMGLVVERFDGFCHGRAGVGGRAAGRPRAALAVLGVAGKQAPAITWRHVDVDP